jgi:TetR/AcrR family transcriptional repressor of nem operon
LIIQVILKLLHPARQRLVETGLYLFWKQGYAATGMAAILAQSKVNSGSFYHFFKSKDDLLLAALQRHIETLNPTIIDPIFTTTSDPIERIFRMLSVYRQNLIATGCAYACPVGRLALEVPPERAAVHSLLSDYFDVWTAAVQRCLDDLGDRLPHPVDKATLAQFVLTVMEGGIMQARAHRNLAPFDASVQHLRNYFNLLLASAIG